MAHLRYFLHIKPALACVIAASFSGTCCHGADTNVNWLTDLAAGQRIAARGNSLLLVIEMAGDFTREPFATPAAAVFQQTTLQDQRVADALGRRVELVCRAVGAPEAFQPHGATAGEGAILYFCDANLRVLHLLVGYPSADRLLEALDAAERLRIDMSAWPEESRKGEALRDWHQIRALAPSLAAFEKQLDQAARRRSAAEAEAGIAPLVVQTANQVRQRELAARFGANWPGRQMPALAGALTIHGDVRTDFAHLILAKLPLATIEQINKLCYETVYERSHWQATPRHADVHRWFVTRILLDRPMLIVLDPQAVGDLPIQQASGAADWKPDTEALANALGLVDTLQLTHTEVAALARDTVLSLPNWKSKRPPRFLLINGERGSPEFYEADDEKPLAKAISLLVRDRRAVDKVARSQLPE